jgi:hypothetical protein
METEPQMSPELYQFYAGTADCSSKPIWRTRLFATWSHYTVKWLACYFEIKEWSQTTLRMNDTIKA